MKLRVFFNKDTEWWKFESSCFGDYVHKNNPNLICVGEEKVAQFETLFNFLLILDRSVRGEENYTNYKEINGRYLLSCFHHHLILNIVTRLQLSLLLLSIAAQNDLPAILRILTEQVIIFSYLMDNVSEFEKFRIAHSQDQTTMYEMHDNLIKRSRQKKLKEIRLLLSNIGSHFNSSYFSNSTSSQTMQPTFLVVKEQNLRSMEIQKILFDLILYILHEIILMELKYWKPIKAPESVALIQEIYNNEIMPLAITSINKDLILSKYQRSI